jgi:hypothetical protein
MVLAFELVRLFVKKGVMALKSLAPLYFSPTHTI